MPGLVGAADRRLMKRWMRRRSAPVDRLLTLLTRAADHSVLWMVIAALEGSAGGGRGRRAAQRGLLALAFTSATVNGPFKLLFGRRRPAGLHRLKRLPRSSSFPSGHSASAFAFAVASSRELPPTGVLVLPLAAGVAYSRVYLGVHYPTDVVAGALFGAAAGMAARPAASRLGMARARARPSVGLPSEAVLVVSPHSGRSRRLARARRALERSAIVVAEQLDISDVDRLPALLRSEAGEPRLVIAAGGDGTVGSVAGHLVGTENVLGIVPLGTGNDFARSLGIPLNPRRAAELLAAGEVSRVDLGRVVCPGQPPAFFAHAATVGLNVDFAKLATQASVRARLGRLTYLAAAAYALRERPSFQCTLHHDGLVEELRLVQLSVISAPVVGGALGLNIRGPWRDEHGLDVLAVQAVGATQILLAGLFLLLGIKRPVTGVRALHLDSLQVDSAQPLGLTLDGELAGALPGQFESVADGVAVLTPRRSQAG